MGHWGTLGIGAGVNIDEVRLKRAEERRKQREKCSNVQMFSGTTSSHVGARTLLYNREDAPTVQLIYEAIRISHEVFSYEERGRGS